MIDKTCKSTVWLTPTHVLDAVRDLFGGQIGLDPATEPDNPTKAYRFFTKEDNGLLNSWNGYGSVFVNPPYGKELMTWVVKICDEACRTWNPIVALLPGQRFETRVWQERLLPCGSLNHIVFIKGRLKFIRPGGEVAKSNPYGSMLYVFNRSREYVERLSTLGHILSVKQ